MCSDRSLPIQAARPVDGLLKALGARSRPVVIVTNEVGLGEVPPTALGRIYSDALGRVNQPVAAAASRVVPVVAALPLQPKGPCRGQ